MGGNDNNNQGNNNQNNVVTDDYDYDYGFKNYVPTTVDPGPWLLIGTVAACFISMAVILPITVRCTHNKKKRKRNAREKGWKFKGGKLKILNRYLAMTDNGERKTDKSAAFPTVEIEMADVDEDPDEFKKASVPQYSRTSKSSLVATDDIIEEEYIKQESKEGPAKLPLTRGVARALKMFRRRPMRIIYTDPNVVGLEPQHTLELRERKVYWSDLITFDKEAKKILKYAIPYTFGSFIQSALGNVTFAIIGHMVGTKSLSAYAVTSILVGMSESFTEGPVYAASTVSMHAFGAGNMRLAGTYVQLAVIFYLLLSAPFMYLWWYYTYDIILFLEWGDEETALIAQNFNRVYMFACIVWGVGDSVHLLLDVRGKVVFGEIISLAESLVDLGVVAYASTHEGFNLQHVAWLYLIVAIVFFFGTLWYCLWKGWYRAFLPGMIGTCGLFNPRAMYNILEQSVPLAFGALLGNAEWAILTIMASALGPAEVTAWAILGGVWEVFEACTYGIGGAAELRCALHLGNNDPNMAKLSAYKSIFMGMIIGVSITCILYSVADYLPAFFTYDETLQAMLRDTIPFIGVGNIALTFGMMCWSLVGAQGRYSLGTKLYFITSWGFTMPVAAVLTYVYNIDLQGMVAAVVVGYVFEGTVLSYVLLCTDWIKVSAKIQRKNACLHEEDDTANEEEREEARDEKLFANIASRKSRGPLPAEIRNMHVITVADGDLNIKVGNNKNGPGVVVLKVEEGSSLLGEIFTGDKLVSFNGVRIWDEMTWNMAKNVKAEERELTFYGDRIIHADFVSGDFLQLITQAEEERRDNLPEIS
mmetsp:Transcript_50335/g.58756  ORF Transcript_50335/g.58756 Transcript_50335/m.58756 type:complete len:816 (+) Transcript_50335:154-2601(+)